MKNTPETISIIGHQGNSLNFTLSFVLFCLFFIIIYFSKSETSLKPIVRCSLSNTKYSSHKGETK
jgi:hypothetical protein